MLRRGSRRVGSLFRWLLLGVLVAFPVLLNSPVLAPKTPAERVAKRSKESNERKSRKDRAREERGAREQKASEPELKPTPQGECGPGSRPETDIQGRVTPEDHASGRAAKGFRCNTKLIGAYTKPNVTGTVGGFKVERYVDAQGRECAYYDSTLLFPTNVLDGNAGVNVLDMTDPSNPTLTARLITPAMLSPHESVVVSEKRGLLAAVLGGPTTAPGIVDVYDVSQDCRHPVLKSSSPIGVLGHESGMAGDGRTFYAASVSFGVLTAVDISNPSDPRRLWSGNYESHGLSISDDGNRAYVADTGSGLIILDTSEIQARKPDPQVPEVARLDWTGRSIPQNAIPVTIRGHPYVVEIDEFGTLDEVGAGRIIDIRNERKPKVISNLRLEVHQKENFDLIANDRGADNSLGGYSGHYCNVPWRTDPGIVACSMPLSGLRVFDIRDPRHPKEIAYFNSPLAMKANPDAGFPNASNWAMSSPAFVPRRREIWYTDGYNGFFAVRITNGKWDFARRSEPAHCRGGADEDGKREGEERGSEDGADPGGGRHHDRRAGCGRGRDGKRHPDKDDGPDDL